MAANHRGVLGRIHWWVCFTTVLFNTGFAFLAIMTLGGIVFITQPKQVMHNVPPWAWLPLLIVMAPAQIYGQFLACRRRQADIQHLLITHPLARNVPL